MVRMVGRSVALVAAGALMLSGCGGSGDDPGGGSDPTTPGTAPTMSAPPVGSAPTGPDPCTLLRRTEVAEAVGADVTRVEGPEEQFMGTTCRWLFSDDLLGEAEASITTWHGLEFYSPDADGTGVTDFEPVAGIGDAAHRWPPGQGICTVIFRSGERVAEVLTMTDDDACVELARTAAQRM